MICIGRKPPKIRMILKNNLKKLKIKLYPIILHSKKKKKRGKKMRKIKKSNVKLASRKYQKIDVELVTRA